MAGLVLVPSPRLNVVGRHTVSVIGVQNLTMLKSLGDFKNTESYLQRF